MRVLVYGVDDLKPAIDRQGVDYSKAFKIVRGIIDSVRREGDKALREYTKRFDGVSIGSIQVSRTEIDKAYSKTDPKVIRALKRAHANIQALHKVQYQGIQEEWSYAVDEGVWVGEKTTPLPSVGAYVPGGRAAYPSTVLMTVTPARIAGVKRIVVVSPPPVPDSVLAACKIAGVDEVYQVGGAQAIAALAYGTKSIRPVSKIVGPGNKYVTAAKMLVYGIVNVDMPAGPSEVLIIADGKANPVYIAADILAQAEHDPNAQCILATDSDRLAKEVMREVEGESKTSKKADILSQSLRNFTVVKTQSITEAVKFANEYAPEHLEIHTKNPDNISKRITNAGAIFIGPYSPVAAGDYASGGNHVLPTGGAARYSSQLTVRDYLKTTSVQKITKEGLRRIAETITTLAQEEGLTEHKKSVEKRLG
ncbi:MAG: histidinol dehydrogenase [Candidatus Altiarchaeota archaeon]